MIASLRQDFVNVWLLAKDLDGIAAGSKDADLAQVCRLVKANYRYPVDSVLITSDLRVVGHVNVHEAAAADPRQYLTFLRQGLAKARGEAVAQEGDLAAKDAAPASGKQGHEGVTRPVVLTSKEPTGTVLDLVQRRGFGERSMGFFAIDATAFAGGGTLELTVRMGGARAAGRFELCAPAEGHPAAMIPVRTLDKVARGETAKLTYEFSKGAMFGLAAMAAGGSAEGDANAFFATVTVRSR